MQPDESALTISFEIAGPTAMFARPDTGSTPISYPVPTYSAAKGMFEAVAWRPSVYIRPTRVEICRPVLYSRYVTNYGGPLRKPTQIKARNNYQLMATVLVDVRYRIHARVKQKDRSGTTDHAEELVARFMERLASGRTFYTPCLGWKEFAPSYFGQLRPDSVPDASVNLRIPSLLYSMWEHRQPHPTYRQNWEVVRGVMSFDHRRPPDVE